MRRFLMFGLLPALFALAAFGAAQTLPKAPIPSQKMLLINVDKEAPEVRFLVHVLQGLVNRTQPRLYVAHGEQDEGQRILKKEGVEFRRISSVPELLEIFKDAYRGGLLYEKECWSNPERAHVINGLITECGLEDLLPVTEELNKEYDLRIKGSAESRWPQVADFYFWAGSKNPLLEKVSRKAMLYRHPWSFAAIDYAVANRLLTVWIDRPTFETERGRRRLLRMLEKTPPETAVLVTRPGADGTPPPGAAVEALAGLEGSELRDFLSGHRKYPVPLDLVTNLSIHSGFRPADLKPKEAAPRPLDRSKNYVALILSDGERAACLSPEWFRRWSGAERGGRPVGWVFHPAMRELAPAVLKHLAESAPSEDDLVPGPDRFGDEPAALHEIWKLSSDDGVGQSAPPFTDFGGEVIPLRDEAAVTTWTRRIATALSEEPRPRLLLIRIDTSGSDPARLADFAGRLPADAVVVRPGELVALYREARK